jgi:hypothetical protein
MIWFIIGIAIGVLNGLTLRWTINRLRPDTALASIPLVTLGFLLRLGLSAGLLVIALQCGIVPGLSAFVGVWLARWITVYTAQPRRSLARLLRR